jgi:transposase
MKVTERNWQMDNGRTAYRSVRFKEDAADPVTEPRGNSARSADRITKDSGMNAKEASDKSDSRIRSSTPDDSVGQLAAELSRSETKLDVLQVLSKATRALANLKMSAYTCEGKDSKKVAQMIRRMEKLIKRIQKKVKQLGKEEQLEIQQKKAEKQKELERAKQIREELRGRRRKRRREERDYAMKELAEDGREAMSETLSGIIGAGSVLSGSPTASGSAAGGMDLSSISMEGMSIDVTV